MNSGVGIDNRRQFSDTQRKSGCLKRRLHLSTLEETEVSPISCGAAIRFRRSELRKRRSKLTWRGGAQLHLKRTKPLDRLIFGDGDVLTSPRRGSPRAPVLYEQMTCPNAINLLRLRTQPRAHRRRDTVHAPTPFDCDLVSTSSQRNSRAQLAAQLAG
eukprot:CAMPEP_0185837170 /NCGR_PEP_ID=MMETSP1353-20130828/10928_1 /TAXON_ID=1077150 /ORGANISM="Erythrolobus australicus, Strain CCMP3124" /LENGTH=157 /DNA_ID=CAMNT_0028536049 /DNA_START=123 /DNA_END=592 /DNA_ORIENTATION=-